MNNDILFNDNKILNELDNWLLNNNLDKTTYEFKNVLKKINPKFQGCILDNFNKLDKSFDCFFKGMNKIKVKLTDNIEFIYDDVIIYYSNKLTYLGYQLKNNYNGNILNCRYIDNSTVYKVKSNGYEVNLTIKNNFKNEDYLKEYLLHLTIPFNINRVSNTISYILKDTKSPSFILTLKDKERILEVSHSDDKVLIKTDKVKKLTKNSLTKNI